MIYYQDDAVTLYHSKCEAVLPLLPAGSIDAVICDLPYGQTACSWDTPIDFVFMWRELKRLTKPAAAIVLFGSQPFTSALVMSNPEWFRYEWIWRKNAGSNFANVQYQPMREHENLLVFARQSPNYYPIKQSRVSPIRKGYTNRSNTGKRQFIDGFINIGFTVTDSDNRCPSSVQEFNRERGLHPTQKPQALLEYLILTYTNPGDTILDFACGSGTCGAAAKKLGRKCIQVEQEAEYCDIAASRLQQEVMHFAD